MPKKYRDFVPETLRVLIASLLSQEEYIRAPDVAE